MGNMHQYNYAPPVFVTKSPRLTHFVDVGLVEDDDEGEYHPTISDVNLPD